MIGTEQMSTQQQQTQQAEKAAEVVTVDYCPTVDELESTLLDSIRSRTADAFLRNPIL